MLIVFKSAACGDLLYFGDVAKHMMELMGKAVTDQGDRHRRAVAGGDCTAGSGHRRRQATTSRPPAGGRTENRSRRGRR